MSRNRFRFVDHLFSKDHKLIVKGIIFFGAFALILAGFIFLFPAFIGMLVAIFMLIAGMLALLVGFRFWKAGNNKTFNSRSRYP